MIEALTQFCKANGIKLIGHHVGTRHCFILKHPSPDLTQLPINQYEVVTTVAGLYHYILVEPEKIL